LPAARIAVIQYGGCYGSLNSMLFGSEGEPFDLISERAWRVDQFLNKWTVKFNSTERNTMLWTISVILVVLWLLGLIGHFGGALIHLLLVIAVIVLVIQLIQGRRV
jgi:hypothetical protein